MAATQQARRDWAGIMQESVLELRDWLTGYPQVTFAEIEAEVDRCWNVLRATSRHPCAPRSRPPCCK